MNMRVVRGDVNTIPVAAGLWLEMVGESRPDWKPDVAQWIEYAERMMQSGTYSQYFVVTDDDVCGFGDGMLFPEPSTGELHCTGQHIYIRPEYRGSRAASLLVNIWSETARAAGARYLDLFSFYGETKRWKKRGFEEVRVLMRKELENV